MNRITPNPLADHTPAVPKILVVDDEPDIEVLLGQMFRRAIRTGKLRFVFARDGEEALETLRAEPDIDMVLTDINMPRMDGLTLLSRLDDVNPMLKAVIISAYGDMENIRAAMNRGAYDFITKPIELADLETTIAKTLREVERIRDVMRQRDDAERAAKAKSDFVAMVSHEVRTPINGVLAMARFLLETSLDPEQREFAETIVHSGEALLAILNDILDFSKIEAGKLDIQSVEVDPRDLVEGVADLLSTRTVEKDIDLACIVDSRVPDRVRGDPDRLRQIITNLVGNAIKFTASGGVEIRVTVDEDHTDAETTATVTLSVEVQDTGIGLSADQRTHLFEPFQQADSSTTREFGGTGLGLSICRRLVELMNGKIGVRSEAGVGSTFWFTVPDLPVEARPASGKVDLSGLVVGAVFDNPGLRSAVSSYLAAAGATVLDIPVASAETVLSGARRPETDVVLVHHRVSAEWALDVMDLEEDAPPILLLAPREFGLQRHPDRGLIFQGDVRMPIRRDGLLRAVAAAAGRSHDIPAPPSRTDTVELRFTPPEIERARDAGCLLLIVEDNPTNQSILRRQMTRLGFAFEMRSDGRAGLESWRSGRHGMVLTDCHMPRMDGYALTRAIREAEMAQEDGPRIPIIALTADALTGTAEQCFTAGMDDYLTKPVDLERLDTTVRRWLPAAEALRGPLQQVSPPALPDEPGGFANIDPKVFDLQFVAETFGTLDEDVRSLFELFLNSTKRLIDQLYDELDHSRLAEARRTAHAVKGAASSTGARELSAVLLDIEKALEVGAETMARVRSRDIGPAWNRVERAITSL